MATPKVDAKAAAAPAPAAVTSTPTAAASNAPTGSAMPADPYASMLQVCPQPENKLAYTNHVFVSPSMTAAYPKGGECCLASPLILFFWWLVI